MINYGSGVSVHTEPGIHTHSRLTVPSATPKHSGNSRIDAKSWIHDEKWSQPGFW